MFAQQYRLYSKEEIISSELFGLGHPNPRLSSFVGDYFAVAIGKDFIYWHKEYEALKGVHAGMRRGELTIPLIIKKAK